MKQKEKIIVPPDFVDLGEETLFEKFMEKFSWKDYLIPQIITYSCSIVSIILNLYVLLNYLR